VNVDDLRTALSEVDGDTEVWVAIMDDRGDSSLSSLVNVGTVDMAPGYTAVELVALDPRDE
jgi:hypothetical protein